MTTFEVIIIAIGLAMDASAVSLAAAAGGYARNGRAVFRLAFHFGLFQALMPIIGWALGVSLIAYLRAWDHWIAFILLTFVGIRMIKEGLDPPEESQKKDPSKGMTMVMLSIATSIDALAVGLSLAVLEVSIWFPSLMIGIITAFMSYVAIKIGSKLGAMLGSKMEVFGGIVLVGIGLKILLSHTG